MQAFYDELPGQWATLCKSKQSATFAWSHAGAEKTSHFVELQPGGVCETTWGSGTWAAVDDEPGRLDISFGAARHICRLDEAGKFKVEERIRLKTGTPLGHPKVKGVQVHTTGWPIASKPAARPKRERAKQGDAKAEDEKEEDGDVEADAGPGDGERRRKKRVKKDPDAPKRPAAGAFGCFLAENREAFAKECPDAPITGVTKLASAKWKEASEAEKDKYQKQYEARKAEYEKAKAAYMKKPPATDEKTVTVDMKKKPAADEMAMSTDVKKKPAADETPMTTDVQRKPAARK